MKSTIKYVVFSLLVITLTSCGGGGDDPEPEEPILTPSKATLIFPENNTECNEGTVLSATESTVIFRWFASENTDSYTVTIRNLLEGTTQSINASTNQQALTLKRATPYSWFVISRSNATNETANSDTWKFYNAGAPIDSYAPFPAEIVNPKMGATVNAGDVLLSWTGEDIDNDIINYDIFLDTSNPPQTKIFTESTATSIIASTESNTIYYWSVLTRDAKNNTSASEVFEFRTN
ncbi:hypothetical protein [Ascidiimonas sp. W6]|uniref:hypothetical protein n=1 Tax=Ascidiimonas meishanensis TaxID=3128903 RepID=UPI0030EEA4F8